MRWFLFAPTVVMSVFSWGVGCLAIALGIACKPRWEGTATLSLEWREWVPDIFPYSSTFIRTIFYISHARDGDAEIGTRTERHEHKHIRQIEEAMWLSTILGSVVYLFSDDWVLALCIQTTGCFWMLLNYVLAGLRYGWSKKRWYYLAEHEISAYAQTEVITAGGKGQSYEELMESFLEVEID